MKKDNLIFLHKLLKAIADSIIKIFIPLYILKVTSNFNLAIAYLAFYSAFTYINMIIFKKIIQKYGVICIILHFLPIVATEAIFSFCDLGLVLIIVSAYLMSLSQTLYSVPLNIIFAFSDKKTNVAKFEIATNIGKLFFTLFSGYILSSSIQNSFLIMSIASTIFYISSVFPIGYAYKELKYNYNKYEHKKVQIDKFFRIFHISFGLFQSTLDYIVPIYLYQNNLSFSAITIYIALVELFKIASNYLANFLIKINKQKVACLISFTIFLTSLICILTIKNSAILYCFSCLCSISFPLTFVPMFKLYCKKAVSKNYVFEQITTRDLDIFSLRAPYFCCSLFGLGVYPCFALGFISVFVMLASELKLISDQSTL